MRIIGCIFTTVVFFSISLHGQSGLAIIGKENVPMYADPNLKAQQIGSVSMGKLVQVLKESAPNVHLEGTPKKTTCNYFLWYRVKNENQEGWIPGEAVFHLDTTTRRGVISTSTYFVRTPDFKRFSIHSASQRSFALTFLINQTDPYSDGSESYTKVEKQICPYTGDNFLVLLEHTDDREVVDGNETVHLLEADDSFQEKYMGMPSFKTTTQKADVAFFKDEKIILLLSQRYDYASIRVIEINKIDGQSRPKASVVYFVDNK